MAQKPLQLVYAETEEKIVSAVNEALSQGLPMFVLEPMLKLIYNEAQSQSYQQHQAQLQEYQAALKTEAEKKQNSENETTGA